MSKNEHGDIRETLKGEYNCIIKNTKYPQQVYTGKISNVLFEESNFNNVIYKNVQFENVIFYKCEFSGCKFDSSRIIYMKKLVFDNCKMTLIEWYNCQFSEMWCFDTVINISKFMNTNLFNSVIVTTAFKQVEFHDNSSLEGVSIIRPIGWFDIEFDNSKGLIKVNRKTNISRFDYKTKVYIKSEKIPVFKDYILNTSFLE